MRRCEKGIAASEVSSERRRKSCRRTTTQVESGSGDPNAGEHRARNTKLHPQGPETAIERHAKHPEPQVQLSLAKEKEEKKKKKNGKQFYALKKIRCLFFFKINVLSDFWQDERGRDPWPRTRSRRSRKRARFWGWCSSRSCYAGRHSFCLTSSSPRVPRVVCRITWWTRFSGWATCPRQSTPSFIPFSIGPSAPRSFAC